MNMQIGAVKELKTISKKCHDMLIKLNKGLATECELISLILEIRDEAAKEYNNITIDIGMHDNGYDLIEEFNKELVSNSKETAPK